MFVEPRSIEADAAGRVLKRLGGFASGRVKDWEWRKEPAEVGSHS